MLRVGGYRDHGMLAAQVWMDYAMVVLGRTRVVGLISLSCYCRVAIGR